MGIVPISPFYCSPSLGKIFKELFEETKILCDRLFSVWMCCFVFVYFLGGLWVKLFPCVLVYFSGHQRGAFIIFLQNCFRTN